MSEVQAHRFAYRFPAIDAAAGGERRLVWEGGAPAFDATLEVDTNPSAHLIRSARGAFTAEECRRIVELGEAQTRLGALVDRSDEGSDYRVSEISWIASRPEAHWLYHKLGVLFAEVNEHYEFELLGLLDAPQYTVYDAAQYFDWHIDVGAGAASVRKLSL